MKTIIMQQTLPLLFNTNEEVNDFVINNNYQLKQLKEVNYLINETNEEVNDKISDFV